MAQAVHTVGSGWTLLTHSDVDVFTVQMRPPVLRTGELFIARGTAETPPAPDAGLFLDLRETSGIAGTDLHTLEPGGEGSRLWARFNGTLATKTCPVWCSWRELVALDA